MKKTNKLISILLAVAMVFATTSALAFASVNETVILYTNDVHCAIDDYPVLAAYKAELETQGKNVIVVDAGDAIQGEVIGALTEGEAVVDIMNAVGYDYAVPGNHEFDYGMNVFLDLAENKASYKYVSSNFHYLPSIEPVFEPYAIEDFGGYQVAFVGISTPETITKSTPEFFKDENNNFIYGFPKDPGGMTNEALYENIQESVDYAIADGADIVVAVGHTGILETSEGWKSIDIIANTDGIDYYIDAHSHETIESATYKNINNEDVVLTSTGTKFANFGVLTISGGNASFELINPDNVDVETMSEEAKSAYNTVQDKVDGYNEEIAYLFEKIGTSEAKLVAYDSDGSWAVRKRETNSGDFVADSYRAVTGADVALCNGGGVRAEIAVGDVTRKMLMDINAFNNDMCVIEVTGQQLIDVLEHGARECPDPIGGFFQVSGVTFEIHTYRETPVITDQLDNFIEMDETKERRVQNVLIGGEPVDLEKTYTLAGSSYVLTQGGDGLTMLEGANVVQQEGLPCDSEILIEYFTETLGGVIPAEKYSDPDGDGRIKIIRSDPDAFEYDYEIGFGETLTVPVNSEEETIIKFTPPKNAAYVLNAQSDELDTYCELYSSDSIEESLITADDENGMDFSLKYDFEAGVTYYFHVKVYDEGDHEFEITLECGHSFENGVCGGCGEACNHTEIGFLGYCLCGESFLGKDINDGDEYELESQSSDDIFWFRFTPEVSGTYSFKSVSENADPDCFLYDVNGEWVAESYDDNGMDFELIYSFEAGETYYFDAHNCYDEGAFTVVLNRQTHTADDGSVHDVEFVEGKYSNCTEHGYTNGLYCSICDEIVSGHEELPLDEECHIDDNFDESCDLCGKENIWDEEECEHICHSDHWFWSFIWRIANFFHKIFNVLLECDCGEAHY